MTRICREKRAVDLALPIHLFRLFEKHEGHKCLVSNLRGESIPRRTRTGSHTGMNIPRGRSSRSDIGGWRPGASHCLPRNSPAE